jgi:hypothetical protein
LNSTFKLSDGVNSNLPSWYNLNLCSSNWLIINSLSFVISIAISPSSVSLWGWKSGIKTELWSANFCNHSWFVNPPYFLYL